jgi:HTH-type transcriptional regulator / antitoxin HigA
MSGESKIFIVEAELETLLLSRLKDDADIEFDIEDVRVEFANRLRKRNVDNRNTKLLDDWRPLANTLYVPHNESEYDRLVGLLDDLIDEVGEDESHPLASLMEVVGVLIEKYEDDNVPELSIAE